MQALRLLTLQMRISCSRVEGLQGMACCQPLRGYRWVNKVLRLSVTFGWVILTTLSLAIYHVVVSD